MTEHSMVTRWNVEVFVSEQDGQSHAEARLRTDDTTSMAGRGVARCNPHDRDVPEIGAELATSRALADLSHQLLDAVVADIEGVTRQSVTLGG